MRPDDVGDSEQPGGGNDMQVVCSEKGGEERRFLERFHAGEKRALEECYRENYEAVAASVGRILNGADRENVIHEVFYRLISSEELRRRFRGGSLGAWLTTVAKNEAIDYVRKHSRERRLGADDIATAESQTGPAFDSEVDARMLIERFRKEALPPAWAGVFETRFMLGLDQREAARRLGISRTTLAYREMRIRASLEKFVLGT